MPTMAGCPSFRTAGYHRALAGTQNSRANERLSGVDLLRHKVCQQIVVEIGFVDMLANCCKADKEFHRSILNINNERIGQCQEGISTGN